MMDNQDKSLISKWRKEAAELRSEFQARYEICGSRSPLQVAICETLERCADELEVLRPVEG